MDFFQPSQVGVLHPQSVSTRAVGGGEESQLSRIAREQAQSLTYLQKQKEEQDNNNNNRNQNQSPTNTQPTADAPQGSDLVSGGPGTGMNASYASDFGLTGATNTGQLGTYGGSTGLMAGTAAGSGAGWSGLGAASSGLTYGGGTAAASAGSLGGTGILGSGTLGGGGYGLGAASTGLTYGGGAAASSGVAAGSGAAMGTGAAAGGTAAAGGAGAAAGGGMSAVFSNPWTALAALIIGGSAYLDNKGISSWGDTLKGKAGSNMLDYYGGKKDGEEHGVLGKVFSQDGSFGQMTHAITDFNELDFSNAFDNVGDSFKNLFKGKIWG